MLLFFSSSRSSNDDMMMYVDDEKMVIGMTIEILFCVIWIHRVDTVDYVCIFASLV